jgi:hypothetical protein
MVTYSSATWYFILPVAELLSLYGDLQYNTAVTVQDIQVVTVITKTVHYYHCSTYYMITGIQLLGFSYILTV